MVVRREKVELILEDQYTAPVLRAAAATNVLKKEINDLSGNAVKGQKSTNALERDVNKLGNTSGRAEKDIDKLSGRIRILGEVLAVVGPAAVPISALAIPAISGLTSVLGFTTVGIGATMLAFRGLGDVLDTVNKARLEPTTENLQAAQDAMAGLTPQTRAFVTELQNFMPYLDRLTNSAAAGAFPGIGTGLRELQQALPQIEKVISAISTATGEVAADAGRSLSSGEWDEFLDFLGTEGPAAIAKMSSAAGSLTHGLAGLWMATQPINDDFLDWLGDGLETFDRWSNDLDNNQGFESFMDYIRTQGPQVGDTLGSVADALIQITQAVAPLGGPSLRIIEAFAEAIASIADSPIGTPLVGLISTMSALSLAGRAYGKIQESTFGAPAVGRVRGYVTALSTVTTAQQRATMSADALAAAEAKRAGVVQAGNRALARNAVTLGTFALASSGAADGLGLTNTASLAMAGSLAGPWGAAIGGAVGGVMDLKAASGDLDEELRNLVTTASSGNFDAFNTSLAAANKHLDDLQNRTSIGDALSDSLGTMGYRVTHPFDFDGSGREEALQGQIAWSKAIAEGVEANKRAKEATDAQTESLAKQAQALNVAREAVRQETDAVSNGFLSYGTAIDNAEQSADEWIAKLGQTAKALANTADNIKTGLNKGLAPEFIQYLVDQGPEGALMLQKIIDGGTDAIKDAKREWRNFQNATEDTQGALGKVAEKQQKIRDKADALARKPFLLVFGIKPGINGQIDAIGEKAAALARKKFSLIFGVSLPGGDKPTKNPKKTAGGGTVPKTGLGYADRHPYLLADGEEVISNRHGQADRNRGLLKAINAGRLADGGTAGGSPFQRYIRDELDLKLPETLKQWNAALAKSTKAIDKETAKRDDLVSKRSDLQSAVSGGFTTDVFGVEKPSNWQYFSAADKNRFLTQDPLDLLNQDTAAATRYDQLLKVLASKGLDGKAFEALARTGDIDRVQAFAGQSNAQLAAFERSFNARERAANAVGKYAGTVVYSKQIDQTNEHLKAMRTQNKSLEDKVDDLKKQVKKSAHDHANSVNKGRKNQQDDVLQQLANP